MSKNLEFSDTVCIEHRSLQTQSVQTPRTTPTTIDMRIRLNDRPFQQWFNRWTLLGQVCSCRAGFSCSSILILLFVFGFLTIATNPIWAQGGDWPEMPLKGEHDFSGPVGRGSGFYLSESKLILALCVFFAWVWTTDWIDRDSRAVKMPTEIWVPVSFFSFFTAFVLALMVPWFSVGGVLLIIAYFAPATTYVILRNRSVLDQDKVLTRNHISGLLDRNRRSKRVEPNHPGMPTDDGPKLAFEAMGAPNPLDNKANSTVAREMPGNLPARELLASSLDKRADQVLLDYTRDTVAVRYHIDGVWHDLPSRDRENGDAMLAVIKKLSALKVDDRRSRQTGQFGAHYKRRDYLCNIVSQGVKTGERVVIQLEGEQRIFATLDEIGMRPQMQEKFQKVLAEKEGMILFSSMPTDGLTTTVNTTLKSMDRYLRDFASVEDHSQREPEVENVDIHTYDTATGQTPATVLPTLMRKQPDVVIVRDLMNQQTLEFLCQQATDEVLVLSTTRAKEAVEALLRVLLLKVPPADFAPIIKAVVNQRLIRKLCDACKEAYVPKAELLAKLGIPKGRIETLYREPQNRTEEEGICEKCNGIGYRGRTSLFEFLVINDNLRNVLVKEPKLEVLRKAAKSGGHWSLQEEGIVLVATGTTSLPELMRVLKQ